MHINATIHVHVVDDKALQSVQDRLDLLLTNINRVFAQGEQLMAAADDMKAVLTRIDTATNTVAAELKDLTDKVATSMSPADVADVQSRLAAAATKLEGVAADPNDPVPAPEPVPVPEPAPGA